LNVSRSTLIIIVIIINEQINVAYSRVWSVDYPIVDSDPQALF